MRRLLVPSWCGRKATRALRRAAQSKDIFTTWRNQCEVDFFMGIRELQQGKTEEAAKLLETVIKELPNYSPAHVLLARVYFKLKRNDDARREQAVIEKGKKSP